MLLQTSFDVQKGSADHPLGSHITSQRRGYLHHGIYVGNGSVVHYSGSNRGLRRGPVEEISLERFACGHPVRLKCHASLRFAPAEVVRRARSRLGENAYRVLSNNCEHFCEWCVVGEQRSYQIEACFKFPSRAFQAAFDLLHQNILWRNSRYESAGLSLNFKSEIPVICETSELFRSADR